MISSARAHPIRFAPWLALLVVLPPMWAEAREELEFFETRIRPVLVEHCYECHSSGAAEIHGGLVLDYRDGLRTGGDSGPAVVPGEPAASLLLDALRHESFEMPPTGKLPMPSSPTSNAGSNAVRRIRAMHPRRPSRPPKRPGRSSWLNAAGGGASSRRAIANFPSVSDSEWGREPVDRFILAGLESAGLSPAPPAKPRRCCGACRSS
jgi:hypothetical protein